MGEIDPDRVAFLDESHAKRTMTKRHGGARPGQRVVDHVPAVGYHETTIVGAHRG
jgi:hypothetical protein